MATKFKLKRSVTSGVVPTTLDIDTAELAVNLFDRKLFTSNGSAVFEIGSNLTNLSVTANLTVNTVIANGATGSNGQVLTSNGTGVYWSTVSAGVTAVNTGIGLTGGPITNTGTISVLANNGITANTTGLFVTQGTGTVVNATGVHVNSAYIGTLAANSATGSLTNTFTVGTGAFFVANGFVGLGTASPLYRLDVVGSTSTGSGLRVLDSDGGAAQIILTEGGNTGQLAESGGTLFLTNFANGGLSISQANPNPINFFTNNINRMIISGNGNIGIGNTTPTHALRVEGGLSLSGTIAVGNTTVNTTVNSTSISTNGIITSSINSGPLAGFRNSIINGDFSIAQRGTSFVSGANNDDTYNLDRWYVLSNGNDTVDITQSTTEIPANGSQTSIALDVENVNRKFGIAQIIEQRNCAGLIGNTVTLSFKARASSTASLDNVKCAIVAWSGTADTVTSDIISAWNVEGTNPTLIANATYENTPANLGVTTSWQTYSVSANVDTINTRNIVVFIWSDVTVTTAGHFLYITDVQLESGTVATPFERRSIGTELALCQRYYFGTGAQFNSAHNATGGGVGGYHWYSLPVVMRIAPTVTASWASLVNATAGTFRMADAKTVETFIISSAIGGYTGVVTYSAFSAEL